MTAHKQITGVLGLPVNQKGQYLLALRNDPRNQKTHKKWEVVGGKLEFDETVTECLQREVHEELGVKPSILFPYPYVISWHPQKGKQVVLITYLISINNHSPRPNHAEILEIKWIYPHQLQELDYLPLTDQIIEYAETMRTRYAFESMLQYTHNR